MARSLKDTKLDTRAARAKFASGDQTHWRMLIPGALHLGYRRRVAGTAGVWIARRYIGKSPQCTSGYLKVTIGRSDDLEDANGVSVLSYSDAQRIALERQAEAAFPKPAPMPTVRECLADYVSYLRTEKKSGHNAEESGRVHILPALGGLTIDQLTLKRLEAWRATLVAAPARMRTRPGDKQRYRPAPTDENQKRARRATVNRVVTVLKAALNRAKRHYPGLSDDPWRQLKPYGKVDVARPGHLTVPEAQRLINAADAASGFRDLVRAGLLTGCRYGELCRLKVADFSQTRLTIRESKSGKPRDVRLTEEGASFFRALTVGRPADQWVFRRPDNGPWAPSLQIRPMRAACAAAGMEPAVGFHQLRHTYASLATEAGMPLMVVAETLGHADTRVVERHYAHLSASYKEEMVNRFAPRFGIETPTNVITIDKMKGAK